MNDLVPYLPAVNATLNSLATLLLLLGYGLISPARGGPSPSDGHRARRLRWCFWSAIWSTIMRPDMCLLQARSRADDLSDNPAYARGPGRDSAVLALVTIWLGYRRPAGTASPLGELDVSDLALRSVTGRGHLPDALPSLPGYRRVIYNEFAVRLRTRDVDEPPSQPREEILQ